MLTIMLQTFDDEEQADATAESLMASEYTTVTRARIVGSEGMTMVCAIYDDSEDAMSLAAVEMIKSSLGLDAGGTLQ